ncbi:MAG: NAD(P)/FAD-dependent oxidoreductase [Bacteroidota bacterium]
MQENKFDVIIVGAGISGIGMAYWLQEKCPDKRFAVLEARETIGGTWSLFQYPGIRSDSDMFTFGYRFRPWTNPQSLSAGQDILAYLQDTINENNLDQYIRYQHKMTSANWSDATQAWELRVNTPSGTEEWECNFLSICTGYYNYKEAYRPSFEGEEQFKGQIVQPQFWPQDLDYDGKKVVVVGSGATAVTLVPAMAEKGAAQVTMLQRSPTYIMNLPNRNQLFIWFKKVLPISWAYRLARWQNITLQMVSFGLSKLFPNFMKSVIMKEAAKQLPEGYPVEKHFNPKYNPWDQRLCVVPDGDLFQSISDGKAQVVTDTISHFTDTGITTTAGEELEADIIVLATGLKIQVLGGADLTLNRESVPFNQAMIYKGMMVSGVPNLIYAFGYTNASWTLKVDLTANYLCKLLHHMDRNNFTVVYPIKEGEVTAEDFLNLDSSYIKRAKEILPKQGASRPWRTYQNYLVDMMATRWGSVRDKWLAFR